MNYKIALILPVLLAACGGGGGGSLPGDFEDRLDEGLRLSDRLDVLSPTFTLPTSEVRGYDGISLFTTDFEATEAYYGDFAGTVDFINGEMDATATDFYFTQVDDFGNPIGSPVRVSGTVDYSADSLDASGFLVATSGNLQVDGASRSVSGDQAFFFFGPDAEMMTGLGEVTVTGSSSLLNVVIAD